LGKCFSGIKDGTYRSALTDVLIDLKSRTRCRICLVENLVVTTHDVVTVLIQRMLEPRGNPHNFTPHDASMMELQTKTPKS